jgi:hypothetical protein
VNVLSEIVQLDHNLVGKEGNALRFVAACYFHDAVRGHANNIQRVLDALRKHA